jgi:microcystin-dependent protein
LGGYRINNLANATAANDAVNKNQLEQNITNLQTAITVLIAQSLNDSVCIGDIKASTQTENHGSWLLCNGQAVSRATYADLFEVIGTSFGEGNGSTTFNVPDYRGKFLRGLGGNSAANMSLTQAEGLPNITGEFSGNCLINNSTSTNGAFYESSTYSTQHAGGSDGSHNRTFAFAASRSSAVYGASEHVTPVNQAVNYFIKAKNI